MIGISAEVAIADYFGVSVSSAYRSRSNRVIVDEIAQIVPDIFERKSIPKPIRHIAEGQNAIDFLLENNQTLSVKTNKRGLGKAAPQRIGQATSQTWFGLLAKDLKLTNIPSTYQERAHLFKRIVFQKIDELLALYWENVFDCDFFLQIYNIVDSNDAPTYSPQYIVIRKIESPQWDKSQIFFTKGNVNEWNESNTVKHFYENTTIGEFQVHRNRDCFKFRFNMAGITELIENEALDFSSAKDSIKKAA